MVGDAVKYQYLLGILSLGGLAACVGASETHLPDGVTYATTGSNTNANPNSDAMNTGTGGNPNSGGMDPNGSTGGVIPNPNTADPNTGNPNNSGTKPQVAIPGLTVTARLNMAKCLDIVGGKTAAGSAIDLFDCNGSALAQEWQLVHGQLRASGNRCLDLPTAPTVDTPLIINPCDDTLPAHQQWTLEEGTLKSNAVSPAFCVALHFGATDNGTVLALATCAASNDAQHWSVNDTNTTVKGFYVVSAAASDHCMVVATDNSVTWEACTSATAAGWTLDGSAKGTAVMNGGNCLAVQGTAVSMVPCNGAAQQLFSIAAGAIRTPDGTQCVGAKPASGMTSAPAVLAPCNVADVGQQWSLGGWGQP